METDTPVTVSNVVDVETPQKRIELPQGKGLFGSSDPKTTLLTGLAALASYGNFLANAANAGGSITTAGVNSNKSTQCLQASRKQSSSSLAHVTVTQRFGITVLG